MAVGNVNRINPAQEAALVQFPSHTMQATCNAAVWAAVYCFVGLVVYRRGY